MTNFYGQILYISGCHANWSLSTPAEAFVPNGEKKNNSLMCMTIRSVAQCAEQSAVQEKLALDVWLPELKGAVQEAQRCLDDCKRVRGLVSWSKLL
jgi:hypothetical protein